MLVIQHVPQEGPGTLGEFLEEKGAVCEIREAYRDGGRALSGVDLSGALGIISMGGPMGVYDEAEHPFLAVEKRLIRELVPAGIPFLGVCLGAQMLACALGGRVTKAADREIGWGTVDRRAAAADDPLFRRLDPSVPVFQWHEDTFELPANSFLLAQGGGLNQAFRCGDRAWGLQFHVEVDAAMIRSWVAAARPDEVPAGAGARMIATYEQIGAAYREQARRLYEGFWEVLSTRRSS
ncbi:MAG: type 1 glutamine amidotransferase [Deltaproteobacteria bacterium]